MISGFSYATHASDLSDLQPVEELFSYFARYDQHYCNDVLDLKLNLKRREAPEACVKTYFTLKQYAGGSFYELILERLRWLLMNRVCMCSYDKEGSEVSYHRVDFEKADWRCFMNHFICRYQHEDCEQCPLKSRFRVVYVPDESS